LGNGAQIERLNFLADLAPRGLKTAHGMMVNYRYNLEVIEKHHEAYAEEGRIIASAAVRRWLRSKALHGQ
jgi:malonyl-CoA decarboxylase